MFFVMTCLLAMKMKFFILFVKVDKMSIPVPVENTTFVSEMTF